TDFFDSIWLPSLFIPGFRSYSGIDIHLFANYFGDYVDQGRTWIVSDIEIQAARTTRDCPSEIASVDVKPASAKVAIGDTLRFSATALDATGNPITGQTFIWATDNPAVATVDGNGLVTGAGPGTTSVSASSQGKSGTASVTVAAGSPNDTFDGTVI